MVINLGDTVINIVEETIKPGGDDKPWRDGNQ